MSEPRPRTESELVDFIRSIGAAAPERLHGEVNALIAARSPDASSQPSADRRRWSARAGLGTRLAGAAALWAAVAVVLAVSLTGGGGSTLNVDQASALTLRAATAPAPARSGADRAQLSAAVDGISFPYWQARFGWRTTGARSDRLGGRSVTTIFYGDRSGRRIGYAIVDGTPPPALSGGAVAWRAGVPYRLLSVNGADAVGWLRDGHLCVVSGRGVDGATLLRLASWTDGTAGTSAISY